MRQHAEAKSAYPDAVLFFRLGDFYEMFGEDAVLCSKVLDLTLTSRNRGKPDEIPMAGVPYHAAHGYIGRLLAAGHKVAVCEQMADPATTKGIVPREVVRVITPGTVTHQDHLTAAENNWLSALQIDDQDVGLALFDLSTGELSASATTSTASALAELSRASPREILIGLGSPTVTRKEVEGALQHAVPSTLVSEDSPLPDTALDELKDLPNAGDLSPASKRAVARVLRFARRCNPKANVAPSRISRWDAEETVHIDATAQRHLELCVSQAGDKRLTLLSTIDRTKTAAGSRKLRRRLLAPLRSVARIRRRQDQVELFVVHSTLRQGLRDLLSGVTDLERLVVRAELGEANPRDLAKVRGGLDAGGRICALLSEPKEPALREVLGLLRPVDVVQDVCQVLTRALVDDPPALAKEGAVFRDEYDEQLSQLQDLRQNGTQRTVELEGRLRRELDIPSLKVRFTRVFGWYVEVGRSHAARVPKTFRRKQTVASGERYTLVELDELSLAIQNAEDQYRQRELELLRDLVRKVSAAGDRIAGLADRLATWDCAAALAEVAHENDYIRPEVDAGTGLEIEDGRHPVVERWAASGRFVPNDVALDSAATRLWIITGPNMAGKSTFLRQTALIVLLAQMGAYVPARRARLGLVDRILSRVGANDNLARGESTFMVEMRETAEILSSATARSLVILDEIGRGTSTFDGLAIAWAVAEHLATSVGCRALFATHYHEMTALAQQTEHVANYSVSARAMDDDIVFLHRLVPGAANQSHGVAVARLAGVPAVVVSRAQELLESFEGSEAPPSGAAPPTRRGASPPAQLSLFQAPSPAPISPGAREVLQALATADIDRLSPLSALSLLAKLKKKASSLG